MKNEKLTKLNTFLLGVVSCLLVPMAQFTSSMSANTTCLLMFHQPEQPDSVKKLRKF